VPAAGLRGGWRDYCIVNAPERSGSGGVRGYEDVGFVASIRGCERGTRWVARGEWSAN
jgi:hypothetical protein